MKTKVSFMWLVFTSENNSMGMQIRIWMQLIWIVKFYLILSGFIELKGSFWGRGGGQGRRSAILVLAGFSDEVKTALFVFFRPHRQCNSGAKRVPCDNIDLLYKEQTLLCFQTVCSGVCSSGQVTESENTHRSSWFSVETQDRHLVKGPFFLLCYSLVWKHGTSLSLERT